MKKIMLPSLAFAFILLTACNSNEKASKKDETSTTNADTSKARTPVASEMKEIAPAFTNVDPKLAASLNAVFDHYFHIKNALVHNDQNEAASGAKAMADVMTKIDKSLFTAEQKKIYDDIEADLKEHADHIGKSKIDHQRNHFSMMSEDVYDLAKAFGAGRTVYHDHCPMANDNKGAMWLSETKEIKNPYFGGKMNECVNIPEVINK